MSTILRSVVPVFIFLIMACGALLVYLPGEAEAALSPTVTVALDQAEQTAQVAPGQKGIVTFTGTVNCVMSVDPAVQKVIVSLEADVGGWAWSITPSTMAFDRQIKDATFAVSVKVPPRTSHIMTQQLTIVGRWKNVPGLLGGTIFPANSMINVKQFYKFQVECVKPFVEISPGDQLVFNLKIRNEGNDQDTIKLIMDPKSEKKLDQMGWAVMLSQSEYIIDEGSDVNVKISITPAQEWNVWKNEVITIKFQIRSHQALSLGEIPVESSYPLYIRERGFSAPGYEMYLVVMAIIPMLAIPLVVGSRRIHRYRRKK